MNNAGINGPIGSTDEVDWDEWERTIRVNLFGSVLCCRAILPHFRANGYGKIIQLSGGGATSPRPRLSAYAASKAAVVRFAETLAEELRDTGIDVNAIAPGALNTRLLDEVLEAGPERVGDAFYERALEQRSGGVHTSRRAVTPRCLPRLRRERRHHREADQRTVGPLDGAALPRRRSPRDGRLHPASHRPGRPRTGLGLMAERRAARLESILTAPPAARLPSFDRGWLTDGEDRAPFLRYVTDDSVNWSEELEQLHDDQGRSHFLDVATRRAMLAVVAKAQPGSMIVDLGCSSGHLLEDLAAGHPGALLVGVDLVESGLRRAHTSVPDAVLLQADARALPLCSSVAEFVVSANLLEHVDDDVGVLREVTRVLRPGGRAVFVVPAAPGLFDYYDRYLGHVRRYGRGELARKAQVAGLRVERVSYLGTLLYPMFWFVKKRNRRFRAELEGDALEQRVATDIAGTTDSSVGRLAMRVEQRLQRLGISPPFGIRCVVAVSRPGASAS